MGQARLFEASRETAGMGGGSPRQIHDRVGRMSLQAIGIGPGWARPARDSCLGHTLDQIADLAMASFGTAATLLCFRDEAPCGLAPERLLDGSPSSPWSYLAQRNDVLVVPDARHDPRLAGRPLRLGATPMRFYASAPLRLRGEHQGVLAVLSLEPRPLGLDEAGRRRLQFLADTLVSQWDLQLHQRRAAQQAAALRQAQEEAEQVALRYQRLLRQRDEVIQMMDHRIGNGLQMATDMLCLQSLGSRDGPLADRLSAAAGRIQAVAELHNQLRRNPSSRRLDAQPYLAALLDSFRKLLPAQQREVTLRPGPPLPLSGLDAPRIGMVAWELLSNATRHGAGHIALELQREGETGLLRVSVEDEGTGFNPDRLNSSSHRDSAGCGLELIRLIAGGPPAAVHAGPPCIVSVLVDISPEG